MIAYKKDRITIKYVIKIGVQMKEEINILSKMLLRLK